VILTTPGKIDAWMTAPALEALTLQRPLPADGVVIVAEAARMMRAVLPSDAATQSLSARIDIVQGMRSRATAEFWDRQAGAGVGRLTVDQMSQFGWRFTLLNAD
jgi:hypothetical protein